jgi:hypothetical protein
MGDSERSGRGARSRRSLLLPLKQIEIHLDHVTKAIWILANESRTIDNLAVQRAASPAGGRGFQCGLQQGNYRAPTRSSVWISRIPDGLVIAFGGGFSVSASCIHKNAREWGRNALPHRFATI